MDEYYDAIIIGGGFARLTAALHLAERGLEPMLLEAANRVLSLSGKETFDAQTYPPPEPLAAWIESLIMQGRKGRRMRRGDGFLKKA